jgi:small multidrug resistance pump
MAWLCLVGAIVCEVAGTLALRAASTGDRRWYAGVVAGYLVALVLLSATLRLGLPLGVAYGIWAALGVALTAVASKVLFDEALTRVMCAGLGLIVAGVLLIELGAVH